MAKTRKELLESKNGGFAFEARIALERHWKRDGRCGSFDLSNKNKIYECKYFRIEEATAKRNAIYNSANGFDVVKSRSLTEQLKEYCATFDVLVVGYGNDPKTCPYFMLKREEAFEWLYFRMQYDAKQKGRIRFCWGGKTVSTRYLSRFEKLKKEGYKI